MLSFHSLQLPPLFARLTSRFAFPTSLFLPTLARLWELHIMPLKVYPDTPLSTLEQANFNSILGDITARIAPYTAQLQAVEDDDALSEAAKDKARGAILSLCREIALIYGVCTSAKSNSSKRMVVYDSVSVRAAMDSKYSTKLENAVRLCALTA